MALAELSSSEGFQNHLRISSKFFDTCDIRIELESNLLDWNVYQRKNKLEKVYIGRWNPALAIKRHNGSGSYNLVTSFLNLKFGLFEKHT